MTATTNFSAGTVVTSTWLNAVDASLFDDVVNVKRHGAVGDGITDDSTAITSAIAAAKLLTAPVIVIPPGTYYCGTTTLVFDLPKHSTVIQYGRIVSAVTGSNSAIRIGTDSGPTWGLTWEGLDVSRTSIDTASTSIGVDIVNINWSKINHRWTDNFGYGIIVRGANSAASYLEMHLGYVYDNKINLLLTASGTGYCNENSFFGGSFGFSSTWFSTMGTYAATYNIYEDNWPASPLNGNKFYGPGLESGGSATIGALIYGQYTRIYAPRLEAASGQLTIVFGSTSTNCFVDGASGVPLAAIVDNSNNKSHSYFCIDGSVLANLAGVGEPIHRSRATNGDSTTRAYEARDTSDIPTAWLEVGGTIRGTRLVLPAVDVTYTTSMTLDTSLGASFKINATNGTAFTINAPTNVRTDQRILINIKNTSGGALGTITWNAIFKMATWTSPTTAYNRSIEFEYNGTNWIEINRTSADVPN
jgi:hypothetical protein